MQGLTWTSCAGARSSVPLLGPCASQQNWSANVRFGSKADISECLSDVCCPRKRTLVEHVVMSALCQKRTLVHGGEHGTVLATRSALNGSNRPVPCARTAAQERGGCERLGSTFGPYQSGAGHGATAVGECRTSA